MPDAVPDRSFRDWTDDERHRLDGAALIRVAGVRADGSLRRLALVGHVRVDGDEVVRSLNGVDGAWYRGALRSRRGLIDVGGHRIAVAFVVDSGREDVVDRAFRARYGDDAGVRQMTRSPAREATLVLRPLREAHA